MYDYVVCPNITDYGKVTVTKIHIENALAHDQIATTQKLGHVAQLRLFLYLCEPLINQHLKQISVTTLIVISGSPFAKQNAHMGPYSRTRYDIYRRPDISPDSHLDQ